MMTMIETIAQHGFFEGRDIQVVPCALFDGSGELVVHDPGDTSSGRDEGAQIVSEFRVFETARIHIR